MRVHVDVSFRLLLVLSVILISAILEGLYSHLIMALVYISLISNDAEPFFFFASHQYTFFSPSCFPSI